MDPRPATVPAPGGRRMALALGASAAAHAVALVAAFLLVRPRAPIEQPVIVFPISLVARPGPPGGGSGGNDTPAVEPAPPPAPEPPRAAEPPRAVEKPKPAPIVKRKPAAKPTPPTEPAPAKGVAEGSTDATGGGAGTASRGAGGGPGSGGGGGGTSASPAYGSNPQPPYPMAARRLHLQGTVVLRVVVAPDGRPTSVSVLESSGHEMLDASALETVRTRWRFVPARRNGIPIEDSVQVPIRFRETAG